MTLLGVTRKLICKTSSLERLRQEKALFLVQGGTDKVEREAAGGASFPVFVRRTTGAAGATPGGGRGKGIRALCDVTKD